jgi:hypothetical protein
MINVGILPKITAKSADISIQLDGFPRILRPPQAAASTHAVFTFAILCFYVAFFGK